MVYGAYLPDEAEGRHVDTSSSPSSHHLRPVQLRKHVQQRVQSEDVHTARSVCFRAEPAVLPFPPSPRTSVPSSDCCLKQPLAEVTLGARFSSCLWCVPPVASTASSSMRYRCPHIPCRCPALSVCHLLCAPPHLPSTSVPGCRHHTKLPAL